jgi:hypothetical protein
MIRACNESIIATWLDARPAGSLNLLISADSLTITSKPASASAMPAVGRANTKSAKRVESAIRKAMVFDNAVITKPNGDTSFAVPVHSALEKFKEVRAASNMSTSNHSRRLDWARGLAAAQAEGRIERLEYEGTVYLRPSWAPTHLKAN